MSSTTASAVIWAVLLLCGLCCVNGEEGGNGGQCKSLDPGDDGNAGDGSKYSYEGDSGPENWSKHYPMCNGCHQSPINIKEEATKLLVLRSLKFKGFEDVPTNSSITNTDEIGAVVTVSGKQSASGGPLKAEYIFQHLHFHWGKPDNNGSEHQVNGKRYSGEMHFVFYNSAYKNLNEATHHKDGLVLMAFFLVVSGKDNPALTPITEMLASVEEVDSSAQLKRPKSLSTFMPATHEQYFTYQGGMTTPPCAEVTQWLVFKDVVLVSDKQLNQLRQLKTHDGSLLSQNFRRPIQPLNGRTVYFSRVLMT